MYTYAIQMVLHFQSEKSNDNRFDAFLKEVHALANKHGISFDDYQSFCLSADDYKIAPCSECGHLTLNRDDIQEHDENILPDFWFYIRRGKALEDNLTCEFCEK